MQVYYKMVYGVIYKISNSVNDKVYYGQTEAQDQREK